jgi:cytochrome c553
MWGYSAAKLSNHATINRNKIIVILINLEANCVISRHIDLNGSKVSLILIALTVFLLPASRPARAENLPVSLAECAACHGEDGIGRDVEIPNLAGQHEVYLYRQLQHFKSGRRAHKEMHYESRQLSDSEMQALAHYYAQLPR